MHPAAPTHAAGDLGALVDLAHRLLTLNLDRSVRVTTGGMLGRDGDLWVYGRGGRQCRRCRTRIERGEIGDPRLEGTEPRVLWFCPRCQPGPGARSGAGRAGREVHDNVRVLMHDVPERVGRLLAVLPGRRPPRARADALHSSMDRATAF